MQLLSPIKVKNQVLRNRIVFAPMRTNLVDTELAVTERLVDYYTRRAAGGAGLIIVEGSSVHQSGMIPRPPVGIHHDKFIPGLAKLASSVQAQGAKIIIQLHHAGRQTTSKATGGMIVGPSAIPWSSKFGETPMALDKSDIQELVEAFVRAAELAAAAGFDGVELHGAHGYLLANFTSPWSNIRTDEYGGSVENRFRFAREIIEGIRKRVRKDFIICYRMNGVDRVDGGLELPEGVRLAQLIEASGVDLIHVSSGTHADDSWISPPMHFPMLCNQDIFPAIKKAVNIPVIAVGKIQPEQAEKLLLDNKADLIAFGRPLLADPDIPTKLAVGGRIRKCIYCNEGCFKRITKGRHVSCIYNPEVGHERESQITRAAQSKRITVVGGGPAGLEAARVAALRGHEVTLYEKSGQLGGTLLAAMAAPLRSGFGEIINYYREELSRLKVNVLFQKTVVAKDFESLPCEVLILATGANFALPKLAGDPGIPAYYVRDVLAQNIDCGNKVVVYGGTQYACEAADYLAERGKEVHLVWSGTRLGAMLTHSSSKDLVHRIKKTCKLALETEIEKVVGNTVLTRKKDGSEISICDVTSVVLELGPIVPRTTVYPQNKQCFEIGDCQNVGRAIDAVHAGFWTALRI